MAVHSPDNASEHGDANEHGDSNEHGDASGHGDANEHGDASDHGDVDLERILARWGILDAESPIRAARAAQIPEGVLANSIDSVDAIPAAPASSASVEPGSPSGSLGNPAAATGQLAASTTRREPFRVPRPQPPGAPGVSTRASRRDSARSSTRTSRDARTRIPRGENRSRSVSLRRIVVAVLAAASLVMAANAVVGASAETPKVVTPVASVTVSTSVADSQPSCRTFAARAPVQPTSSAPATIRGDAGWKSVLQALDRARVATLTAGDVADLDAVDAVGSPAARADATTLCQLRAANLRPVGWRTTLIHVHALSQTTTRVALDIVDTRSAYDLVRNEDPIQVASAIPSAAAIRVDRDGTSRSITAVVVAHRPARGQLHWLVSLTWNGTAWVIHDTAQVT